MEKERVELKVTSSEIDLQTKITMYLLKKTKIKEMFAKEGEEFKKEILKKWRKPEQKKPSSFITQKYHVDTLVFQGMTCYRVYKNPSAKAAIYIHGGGYVMEGTSGQWGLIAELIETTGVTVYYPVYPLAPESDLEPTYELLEDMYRGMLKKHKPSDIVVMGDSAGGGISLAFALLLKEKKLPQPKALFLLSPALRFGEVMEQEMKEMLELEKKDIFLASGSFETIGAWWAGKRDPKDPLVSPYYGDLTGLGHIYIYTGTGDVLFVICKEFIEKLLEEKIDFTYEIKEDMFHCWMIFPIKEGKKAKEEILNQVKKELEI